MLPAFIPGRVLSQQFYHELVAPILAAHYPGLAYAAGHLGSGSDVLGFDTELSRDHDWGPTVVLFLRTDDAALTDAIRTTLGQYLPPAFRGYPTGLVESPAEPGTRILSQTGDHGRINHHVFATTVASFCLRQLGWHPGGGLTPADWLSFPSQQLRSIVMGSLFHDGIGELTGLRAQLAWYPDSVWRYLLACGWRRIDQEDHLMSRAGHAGDELGSALIGARLVRDLMALAFLLERSYAPYPKWYGTAFRQLECASQLQPLLEQVLVARQWPEREAALLQAGQFVAHIQNQTGLVGLIDPTPASFWNRPFQVLHTERFVDALLQSITDPQVQAIAAATLIGSIDQWSDSTDLRSEPAWHTQIARLYAPDDLAG